MEIINAELPPGCGMTCIGICYSMCYIIMYGVVINDDVAWTGVLF